MICNHARFSKRLKGKIDGFGKKFSDNTNTVYPPEADPRQHTPNVDANATSSYNRYLQEVEVESNENDGVAKRTTINFGVQRSPRSPRAQQQYKQRHLSQIRLVATDAIDEDVASLPQNPFAIVQPRAKVVAPSDFFNAIPATDTDSLPFPLSRQAQGISLEEQPQGPVHTRRSSNTLTIQRQLQNPSTSDHTFFQSHTPIAQIPTPMLPTTGLFIPTPQPMLTPTFLQSTTPTPTPTFRPTLPPTQAQSPSTKPSSNPFVAKSYEQQAKINMDMQLSDIFSPTASSSVPPTSSPFTSPQMHTILAPTQTSRTNTDPAGTGRRAVEARTSPLLSSPSPFPARPSFSPAITHPFASYPVFSPSPTFSPSVPHPQPAFYLSHSHSSSNFSPSLSPSLTPPSSTANTMYIPTFNPSQQSQQQSSGYSSHDNINQNLL